MSKIDYAYNGLGQRVSQDASGTLTEYLLDMQPGLANVIATSTSGNVERYVHSPMGVLSHENASGDWNWMLNDGLGSVRSVYNDSLSEIYNAEYAPYGDIWNSTGINPTPFQFTGQEMDSSGLQYHRARYYDPRIGAWLSLDPLETANRYAYVMGDPVNMVDPSGNVPACHDENDDCSFCLQFSSQSMQGFPANPEIHLQTGFCMDLCQHGGTLIQLPDGRYGIQIELSPEFRYAGGAFLFFAGILNTVAPPYGSGVEESVNLKLAGLGLLLLVQTVAIAVVTVNRGDNNYSCSDTGISLYRGMMGTTIPLTDAASPGPKRRLDADISGEIPLDNDGNVRPYTGGISVAPFTPLNLPLHRRNIGDGATGKDPVWCISDSHIQQHALLHYRQDQPHHGLIEPTSIMSPDTYRAALWSTAHLWTKVS